MNIQPDFSLILAILAVLVLFGILYNSLIGWAERKHYLEGFTSLAVALGVLITLGGVAVVSWQAALITLAAFIATGSPMIAGSIWRYIQMRRKEQKHVRQAARMAKPGENSQGPGR